MYVNVYCLFLSLESKFHEDRYSVNFVHHMDPMTRTLYSTVNTQYIFADWTNEWTNCEHDFYTWNLNIFKLLFVILPTLFVYFFPFPQKIYFLGMVLIFFSSKDSKFYECQLLIRFLNTSLLSNSPIKSLWSLQLLIWSHHLVF